MMSNGSDPVAATDAWLGEEAATPPSNAEPQALPETVGRYRVERLLGKGGFGRVFLGFDSQLQRAVAIKVPDRQLVAASEQAETYLSEARMVARLDHPHIVPVYDVGSSPEFPCFVVSKLIRGGDLASTLSTSRMSHAE